MLCVRGRMERGREGERERGRWRDVGWRIANCAALLIVAGMVVSPWVIRNQRVFGKPIVTTTHGGYTLLLGNNEGFYHWLRNNPENVPWGAPSYQNGDDPFGYPNWKVLLIWGAGDELTSDRRRYEEAKKAITSFPQMCAIASFYRMSQLWSPLPNRLTAEESTGRRLMRYAVASWYCGVYLLAAVGIWQLRWKVIQPPWVWGVLLCLVFTGVHTFYWSNLRMRAPLMPFVACVAVAALSAKPSRDRSPK
jgi:hypothetical protein